MLETLRVRACIRERLHAGLLGPYVDGFVDVLMQAGYQCSIRRRTASTRADRAAFPCPMSRPPCLRTEAHEIGRASCRERV